MRRIIRGRRYDTEAKHTELVATHSRGYASDFDHIIEQLYRTGHGNWFLACAGGPGSRYAEMMSCNEWGSGERIIPMNADEAQGWLERHDETEAIEQYFGDEVTDA